MVWGEWKGVWLGGRETIGIKGDRLKKGEKLGLKGGRGDLG
jgi:hypothetical protein